MKKLLILAVLPTVIFAQEVVAEPAKPSFLDNINMYLLIALILSEGIAQLPSVKSNSIFQLIQNILKKIVGKKVEIKDAE